MKAPPERENPDSPMAGPDSLRFVERRWCGAAKRNWDSETSRRNLFMPGDTRRQNVRECIRISRVKSSNAGRGGFSRVALGWKAKGPWAGEELRETCSPTPHLRALQGRHSPPKIPPLLSSAEARSDALLGKGGAQVKSLEKTPKRDPL